MAAFEMRANISAAAPQRRFVIGGSLLRCLLSAVWIDNSKPGPVRRFAEGGSPASGLSFGYTVQTVTAVSVNIEKSLRDAHDGAQ